MSTFTRAALAATCLLVAATTAGMGSAAAQARGKYDTGASDTEIKVGQTAPYSGPVSAGGELAKTTAAYATMINEKGGINGRKITLISLDDTYSPPKSVEQVRRLVEQDEVLFVFAQFGTPTAAAAQKYLNAKKVPQLFAASGSTKFNDPSSPWTTSSMPSNVAEGALFGSYVAGKMKSAKVAILFQNDDFGKDYVKGFRSAIEKNKGIEIVKELSYEPTDSTIDSQVGTLAASGADVFLNVTAGRAAAQSIRAVANSNWKPLHLMNGPWANVETIFKPAGVEKALGIITASYMKSPTDPTWASDPAIQEYLAFMKKYRAGADANSALNVAGYLYGQVLELVLRTAGNDLTRENINRIALSLHDPKFGVLLPSAKVATSPSQRHLIAEQILTRFDGEKLVPLEAK